MEKIKNTHGGANRGQGRKPKGYYPNNVLISATINEEISNMIKELRNDSDISTSELIRIAIKEKYYKDIREKI